MRWDSWTFDFSQKTYLMGIVNLTPDSFSRDGIYKDSAKAVSLAEEMVSAGADIIDIGGESTRPGAQGVSLAEEIDRVVPVIKKLRKGIKVPISIDTYKADVAWAALDAGASLVNDVTALRGDRRMSGVIAKNNVPVVIMHMKGTSRTMQENPQYINLIKEIIGFLSEGIERAIAAGISRNMIIVDPGIGFAKTVAHNLEIIRRLREFKSLGCPILIGTSRKSFIGRVLNIEEPLNRVMGTAVSVALSIANEANIVRVHDVAKMFEVVRLTDAILRGKDNA